MSCTSYVRRQRLLDTRGSERDLADAGTRRVGERVGECRRGRALRRLAGAEERLARTVDEVHFHAVRKLRKAQDRIAGPVAARDPRALEAHRFVQRPAERLHDAPFDLVLDAVGVHDLAAVVRSHGAYHAHAPAFAVDLSLAGDCRVRGEVLVARETEAAAAAGLPAVGLPAEALGGGAHHGLRAWILEVSEAEGDRIGARSRGELVHEAFDGEDVHVRAQRTKRGHAQRHFGDEVVHHAGVREPVERDRVAIAAAGRLGDRPGRGRREGLFEMPGRREVAGGAGARRVRVAPDLVLEVRYPAGVQARARPGYHGRTVRLT